MPRTPLFLLATILMLVSAAALPAAEVLIGGTSVQLPEPRGCGQLTGEQGTYLERAEAMVPKSNQLLAYFITRADLDRIQKGESPDFQYNLSAQTLRASENRVTTLEEFKKVCDLLKNQNQQLISQVEKETPGLVAQINGQLAQNSKVKLDATLARMVPMEPHETTPTSLAFTMMVTASRPGADGAAQSITTMVDTSLLLLNGKIVFLYFNSPTAQLETVRGTAKEWRDAVMAANPVVAVSSTLTEGSAGKDTFMLQRALIGACIGAVLGGIIGVIRGRKIRQAKQGEG